MPPSRANKGYQLPAVVDPPRSGVCVPVPEDDNHRRAFLDALYRLSWAKNWQWDGTDRGLDVSYVWKEIYFEVAEKIGVLDCEESESECHTYPNTSAFIQYFPNDPRYTPDLVPDGYLFPPWYFATPTSNSLLGTLDGDIVTDISRLPPGSLPTILPASGLPRCRVNVNVAAGTTIRVYMRNLLAGSMMQITVDDNPLPVWFIDVTKDVLSIPPETGDLIIWEYTFEEAGNHHADLIVVSKVNDEIPFIFHGGAIVRVEICGDFNYVPAITNMQVVDCELQVQYDGLPGWTTIGAFMPIDASCNFTDDVTIDKTDVNQVAPALALNHLGYAGINGATDMVFRGEQTDSTLTDLVRLRARFGSATPGAWQAQLEVFVNTLTGSRVVANFDNLAALQLNQYGSRYGLYIRPDSSASLNPLLVQGADGVATLAHALTGETAVTRKLTGAATASNALNIIGQASGVTPAAGFGTRLTFLANTSTGGVQNQARINAVWATATHAARQGELQLRASDYTGDYEGLAISAVDGNPALGVLNKTPITRQTATGNTEVAAINSLANILEDFGFITNNISISDPGTSLQNALGDRNLPPGIIVDTCEAANFVAQFIYNLTDYAFGIIPQTAEAVYADLRNNHGNVLTQLWLYAQYIDAYRADEIDILAEIADALPDLVIIIHENLYSPAIVSTYAAAYGGFSTETQQLVSSLVASWSYPTWLELLFDGEIVGDATYSCEPCAGGAPVHGTWAIEWDETADDWVNIVCGIGFDVENGCPSSHAATTVRWDPDQGATTANIVWVEVDIAYDLEDNRIIDGFFSGGGGIGTTGLVSGAGTHTFTGDFTVGGLDMPGDINYCEITVDMTGLLQAGDFVRITAIRIEGDATMPPHNGSEC